MNEYWYVSLPYATFLVEATDGCVTRVPPIAHWARGKVLTAVLEYYRRKGATVERMVAA